MFPGVGQYNQDDYADLVSIAKIKAEIEGSTVQILPQVHYKSAEYKELFGDLIGTEYERKCPDYKVITTRGNRNYVEYESFQRPFKGRKLQRMLKDGAVQSSKIIIDSRDSNITGAKVRVAVNKLHRDPTFEGHINNVWIYDGRTLHLVWGAKK